MSHNKQKFGKSKFESKVESDLGRNRNTRTEKKVKEDLPKIVFSFKDFDIKQIPPGQSYSDWQENKLLAYMLEKFGHICDLNIVEAQQQKVLTIYGDFPENSDFKHPQHITDDVNWAVIRNINGQKGRVAGHIIENIFFVVFLDKEHKFFIAEKKHT